jgi:hypothetical protein
VGACSYCGGAYKLKDEFKYKALPLLDEFKGHPSFKHFADEGYTVLTL